jgi:heme-degrading monooxygenase HmoA
VIVRIWHAEIELQRLEEYLTFAQSISLAMFRAHAGFLGVFFGRSGQRVAVITVWREASDVNALADSPRYAETVAALEATGLIVSTGSVEIFEVDNHSLEGAIRLET